MDAEPRTSGATLERYVPRIATDWDRDAPGRRWQELDATLCFVDISGFTNLSEKLARRGRIGAEELTSVLNYVFGTMLELAYAQGGSLLKFGGDALLLLYTGHDHATRAVSTAVEMRSALKAAEDYQTSVGRLRLRMSTGIHTGPIHLFRVGSSHQELVIAGPGGTLTTVMEKTADPGEIVMSEGTKERLPDDAVGDRKGSGWLVKWRKAHGLSPGPIVRDALDRIEVEEWIPRGLREFLSAGEAEPEHRIASVGFVRYCGIDKAMETISADWVADAIHTTMMVLQEAADAEGITFLGTDINEDGGKVILVAGAPVALEEDEGRLLRAARRMADADTPLDIHIGVNRGHVFTGEVGTPFRATYTVMGDTVNLSARLMAAAHAGTIYATPGLLDQSGTLFASTPLDQFYVKGKEEPVTAYSVGEELGKRSLDERDELPFVGRQDDLANVQAHLEEARAGEGSVVTLVGDAGLGKSRLAREAMRMSDDLPAVVMRAEPYSSATPYRPLRDRMREMLDIERGPNDDMAQALKERLTAIAPDLLPMLPLIASVAHIDIPDTPETAAIEPRFRQDRLTDVVTSLLDRLLTEPMVLLIEDAQWMDGPSAHVLSHFTDTHAERPWAIIITRRTEDGGLVAAVGDEVEVKELSEEEAKRLVIEITQAAPLHPHEIEAIVTRTGGNPLFIAEVLRVVRSTGGTAELPDSLGTLVSTRIDALSTLSRRILRYASVLGTSFRASTVNTILSEDGLELDAATREVLREFLEPIGEDQLQFRTPMVRDVAYEALSFRRREELHRRAAAAIAKTTHGHPEEAADQLAMHYFLGNDHENTWRFARVAADKAAHAFANAEAATQLERALVAGRHLHHVDDAHIARVWAQLGDVREHAGNFELALDAYRRATRLTDDPANRAAVLLKRAEVRERAADYRTALSDAARARHAAETSGADDGLALRAQATAFRGLVRLRQGRLGDASREAHSAADLASQAGERAALARAFSVLAWVGVMSDDPDAAELCERALELYTEVGDLAGQNHMNNNLGFLAYFDNRWDDALAYYEASRTGAERIGNVVDAVFAETNIGELLVNQRRFDRAEIRLEDAVRVLRATGEVSMATFAEMLLARVYLERGELIRAEADLRDVMAESADIGFTTVTVEAGLHLADVTRRSGNPGGALEAIDAAMTGGGEEAAEFAMLEARLRSDALAQLGRVDDALEVLDHAIGEAESRGMLYDLALLLMRRSELGIDRESMPSRANERAQHVFHQLGIADGTPTEARMGHPTG